MEEAQIELQKGEKKMEKIKVALRLGVGNSALVQYPAYLTEDIKLGNDVHPIPEIGVYPIPTINMRLQKVARLDDQFAYFEDGSKIERYRISKIFIGKETFEPEEFSPLRIIEEDEKNLKKEESK